MPALRRAAPTTLLIGFLTLLMQGLRGAPPLEEAPLGLDAPPRVLEKTEGIYPKAMIVNLTRGLVTTEVIVGRDGRPRRPRVLVCTHFEFETPAIEATLGWKFSPARKAGVPVEAPFQVSIQFNLVGDRVLDYVHSTPAFIVPDKSPADYPTELQYDVAPFPLLHCRPVYPRELLQKNVKGDATVVFLIDPSGRPRRIEVSGASRPEFADATRAMVGAWRFTPAKKAGKPTWTTLSYRQIFNKADRETPFNPMTAKLLEAMKSNSARILDQVDSLDARPTLRYQAEPTVPDGVVKSGKTATAEIEFILDEEGHVQLPRVASATDADFGWAAATAVARWIFTVPTKDGKPVNVMMRIPVEYAPPSAAAVPARAQEG